MKRMLITVLAFALTLIPLGVSVNAQEYGDIFVPTKINAEGGKASKINPALEKLSEDYKSYLGLNLGSSQGFEYSDPFMPTLDGVNSSPDVFATLIGEDAAGFTIPADMKLVQSIPLSKYGLTYERYQQFYGNRLAEVLGGQITIYRDNSSGVIALVIGSHYPEIVATNGMNVSEDDAKGVVEQDVGPGNARRQNNPANQIPVPENAGISDDRSFAPRNIQKSILMINPNTGKYFYQVETSGLSSRWFHWVDADNRAILNKYNAIAELCEGVPAPCGFGVEHDNTVTDVKDLTSLTFSFPEPFNDFGLLSPLSACGGGSNFNRQRTFDALSVLPLPNGFPLALDLNNEWVESGNVSPSQQALVDAHYYSNVTDDYFCQVHGFDWVGAGFADPSHDVASMIIIAHFGSESNNAFWNGVFVAFGDGDQVNFEEFTSLDIVSHELTHGVTDFTSNLIYQNESGALNESISDIMAANIEFYADTNGLEPANTLEPDFQVGEDIVLQPDAVPGIRNMADPEEDSDPDHYTERFTGTGDNGGVHINSAISNHAYYLLVNGGMNASCANPSTHNSAHCTDNTDTQDNNLNVTSIGLSDAEQIFFLGFAGLPQNSTICGGRSATEAAADTLFGPASQQKQSTTNAWVAVGLTDLQCGITTGVSVSGATTLQFRAGTGGRASVGISCTGGFSADTVPADNGAWEIAGVPEETCTLTATARGYLNAEGSVTVGSSPVVMLANELLAGDADHNDFININDITGIIAKFGQIAAGCEIEGRVVDLDCNDFVNINDITGAISNFGKGVQPFPTS